MKTPSPSRVAGIFQAPPAVVEDVYQWGIQILCARWLDRLPMKRAGVDAKIEEAKEDGNDWKRGFHENRLLNLKLAEKLAVKQARGTKARNFRQVTMMEPDFKGWRYLPEIERRTGSTPDELLGGTAERTYTAVIEEKKQRLHGTWNTRDFRLYFTLWFDPHDVVTFKASSQDFHKLVVHEVAHLGQSYMTLLLDLSTSAGLPSRSLAEPGYSPNGIPTLSQGGEQEEHALREVEFHTRLQDEVTSFLETAPRIPKSERREALRVWTGASPRSSITFRPDEGMTTVIRSTSFFDALKRSNRAKWRKAAAEFVKSVAQQIEVP